MNNIDFYEERHLQLCSDLLDRLSQVHPSKMTSNGCYNSGYRNLNTRIGNFNFCLSQRSEELSWTGTGAGFEINTHEDNIAEGISLGVYIKNGIGPEQIRRVGELLQKVEGIYRTKIEWDDLTQSRLEILLRSKVD